MFKKNGIPGWVKEFPYELDRVALINLAKVTKGSFDHPREMIYSLYGLKDQDTIENIRAILEEKGWECALFKEEDGAYLLESKKDNYILSHDNYVNDTQSFLQLAERYKIGYDGWHAGQ